MPDVSSKKRRASRNPNEAGAGGAKRLADDETLRRS